VLPPRRAGHLRRAAFEAIDLAIGAALDVDGGDIGAQQRLVIRIVVVAMAGDLGSNDPVGLVVGAVMRERRIAAEHAAAIGVHHAAADRVIDLEPDLVKTLQQQPIPPAPCNADI